MSSIDSGGFRRLLLGLALLAAGCGGAPLPVRPPAPTLQPGMGLVVAEVAAADHGWPTLVWQPEIIIDGRSVGTVIDGLVVLALEPGSYVLESFRRETPGGGGTTTFSGVSVSVQRVDISTTPIRQAFTVSSGRITNLGLIYLARSATGGVAPVRVENDEDMAHLLGAFYPDLLRKLDPKFIRPASGVTADAGMLQLLRRRAAVEASAVASSW